MERRLRVTPIVLCLGMPLALAVAATTADAQQSVTYAAVGGRVVDPTGAMLPNAAVTAVAENTHQMWTERTDSQGRFRFLYLPIGPYRIAATMPGFTEAGQRVVLSVGAELDVPLALMVEGTSTAVQVAAGSSVLLETGRSQSSQVIGETEALEVPLAGRNTLDLALLLPGVSATNTAANQTLAESSETPGQGYSINSQRNISNSFVIDGLSANDDAAALAGAVIGPEAVREFQVVTSGGQAEFGRALGGYVNLVTRSGTNRVHGSAYGFLRNQRLNAQNALSRTRLPMTSGQYGASLGGPVRRDRVFLYGNFEEQRLRTDGVVTVTAANATAIDARLSTLGYGAPLLPIVNGSTLYPTTLHTDNLFVRADGRLGMNDQVNARYTHYQLSSLDARGNGGLNEVSNGTSVFDTNDTLAAGNVWEITPHVFNETRGQWVRDHLDAPPNDLLGPAVTISGVAVFGRSVSSPTARYNTLGEVVDNLVLQHGTHTFKTGIDFLYNDDTITFPMAARGSYTFSSLANFQAGTYNTQGFTQNFGTPVVSQTNPNLGLYAQDEWRIGRALTVNLGMRYDLAWLQTLATDVDNVSPRVGLAWSPYRDRKTVFRASYGLFYDRIPLRPLANALLSANNSTDPTQARLLSYTFSPGQAGAPTFPAIAAAPPAGALINYVLMNPHLQTPGSVELSVGMEQQLGPGGRLDLSYQQVRGQHLIGYINTNINPNGSRPDPTRGNVKNYTGAFDSRFDGLEASWQQKGGAWGSLRVSYAWSKALDDVGEFFFSAPINNFNLREDWSRSDDDQRHRLTAEGSLMSSRRRAAGWTGHVTHGWTVTGVFSYSSRLPFNIVTGTTSLQGTTQRPCVGSYSLTGTNPCTEALPGAVIGRNAGIGFDQTALNARLTRAVRLREGLSLDLFAEAFNALNHRNNQIPNGTWGSGLYPTTASATFAQPTAVADPRSVELAARFRF